LSDDEIIKLMNENIEKRMMEIKTAFPDHCSFFLFDPKENKYCFTEEGVILKKNDVAES
jgi:hypothetical protein